MRRILKNTGTILLLLTLVWCGGIWAEKEYLRNEVLRLQIITSAGTEALEQVQEIQNIVINYLDGISGNHAKAETIAADLQKHLNQSPYVSNHVIKNIGSSENFLVTLERKPYKWNKYNPDALPSGVYHSLQIIFSNCIQGNDISPASYGAAAEKHFINRIIDLSTRKSPDFTLADTENTSIRFLFLEYLGRLENIFFSL